MSEERKPRNSDTREASTRTSDAWVPASILPDPQPQDGWVFRWVRTRLGVRVLDGPLKVVVLKFCCHI